jgi:hypothetical protein
MRWPFLSLMTNLDLKSTLHDICLPIPAYFGLPLTWLTFFYPFIPFLNFHPKIDFVSFNKEGFL